MFVQNNLEGEIELRDLEMKPDLLLMLGIDLDITHNSIGLVRIKIPWKKLYTEVKGRDNEVRTHWKKEK